MVERRDGGPAFPDMTLRDWFAGMALQGLCANHVAMNTSATFVKDEGVEAGFRMTTAMAYGFADAMLTIRAIESEEDE